MKKLIILIIIIAITGAGGFAVYRHLHSGNKNALKFSGELEMTKVDVSFRVSGLMTERFFSEGQKVKEGDLLAEIDPAEYSAQLKLAQADALAAQWTLTELNAGNTEEDIEQVKKQLQSAKTEEVRAKKDFDRTKRLYDAKSVSASEYDKISAAYNVARFKAAELDQRLKQMEIGPRKEKIEQAKAKLTAAEANAELAQQRLDYAKIYSPLTGVVLDTYKEAGEFIQAGSPIMSVGDPDKLWLRAYLPENQAHMIRLGQKMTVTVDGLPEENFQGVVSFISDKAEFTPKQIQTSVERVKLVYRIKIDIMDTKGLLKPGVPADAIPEE